MVRSIAAAAIAALFVPVVQAAAPVGWDKLWTFTHGETTSVAGQTSEILAFDSLNNELWVGGLKGVDILNAATGSFVQHIDTTMFGELNSVAIRNGIAAFAIAAPVKTDAGSVLTYNTTSRSFQQSYLVGALPDMVTFAADGRILTANEGEPLARVGLRDGRSARFDQHHRHHEGFGHHARLRRFRRHDRPRPHRVAGQQAVDRLGAGIHRTVEGWPVGDGHAAGSECRGEDRSGVAGDRVGHFARPEGPQPAGK
jgi:hypothetical protein